MKKILIGLAALMVCSSAFAGSTAPWADTLFVRGGFNGWGTTDPMTYDSGTGTYTAVLSIDAGLWEFKIANADWNNPDFGPTGDTNITLGSLSDIGTSIGANFVLDLVVSGNYQFTLSDIAPDLQSGKLLVEQVIPIPAAGLLLLSAIGGLGFFRRK